MNCIERIEILEGEGGGHTRGDVRLKNPVAVAGLLDDGAGAGLAKGRTLKGPGQCDSNKQEKYML